MRDERPYPMTAQPLAADLAGAGEVAAAPGVNAFAIGTFAADDAIAFPGLVAGDRVTDLRAEFGPTATTATLLDSWDRAVERLTTIANSTARASMDLSSVRALPPIQPVGQVLCAGANYEQHTLEMTYVIAREQALAAGGPVDEDALWAQSQSVIDGQRKLGKPFMFVASPAALCGANDDIVLWTPGVQHDWELELAVVIGKHAHRIAPSQALDAVAGYTISNDISTRDVMFRPNFGLSDFMTSKNRPTFFPTGPYFVPKQFVPDYRQLRIQLTLNGTVMQDACAGDMMYSVEALVSYASELVELRPGDLILTGSPGGNAGIHGNRWLEPGDTIVSEITGLGVQVNRCVSDPRSAA